MARILAGHFFFYNLNIQGIFIERIKNRYVFRSVMLFLYFHKKNNGMISIAHFVITGLV